MISLPATLTRVDYGDVTESPTQQLLLCVCFVVMVLQWQSQKSAQFHFEFVLKLVVVFGCKGLIKSLYLIKHLVIE